MSWASSEDREELGEPTEKEQHREHVYEGGGWCWGWPRARSATKLFESDGAWEVAQRNVNSELEQNGGGAGDGHRQHHQHNKDSIETVLDDTCGDLRNLFLFLDRAGLDYVTSFFFCKRDAAETPASIPRPLCLRCAHHFSTVEHNSFTTVISRVVLLYPP